CAHPDRPYLRLRTSCALIMPCSSLGSWPCAENNAVAYNRRMVEDRAELSDQALLEAWRAGDRELGNQLFRRHIRSVSRFFRTKVPEAAEDLTQQTFLALAEVDPARLGKVQFRAYLF